MPRQTGSTSSGEPAAGAAANGEAPPALKPTHDERDVAVARKLFWAGCAFLPWLWIMCLLHYRERWFDAGAPPALRWYLRAQAVGLVLATAAFVAWEVVFQLGWRSWGALGTNMLIYVPGSDATQWWLQQG
jgi:hypothetical protein